MKYTVMGFSQEKLLYYGLDLIDVMIIRWFVDFRGTGRMVEEIYKGKAYDWIDYESLIEEIPIIGIQSKIALRRRLKKLVDKKILIHHTKKVGGTYSFYNLGQNYINLVSFENTGKKTGVKLKSLKGQTQKFKGLNSKVQPKDSSTKDSSTKDSSIKNSSIQQQKKNMKNKINNKKSVVEKPHQKNKQLKTVKEYKQVNTNELNKIIELQKKFKSVIGVETTLQYITNIVKENGYNNLEIVLDKFESIRPAGKIKNVLGLIRDATRKESQKKGYKENKAIAAIKESPINNRKPEQSTNFDQRKYDDEFFESLYDNLK